MFNIIYGFLKITYSLILIGFTRKAYVNKLVVLRTTINPRFEKGQLLHSKTKDSNANIEK